MTLQKLLGSRLRAKVLAWLFSHPDERYYVRQLTSLLEEDSTNVSRELARLETTGILISAVEGKQKYYQADCRSPLFNDLVNIMKHAGAQKPVGSQVSPPSRVRDAHVPYAPDKARKRSPRPAVPKRKLAAFCRRNHIRRLSLFGSVLRKDFRPDSDVDVLVEFEPGHVPGFFKLADMEEELSALFGRKVDVRTPGDLSRYIRQRVLEEAEVQYAAAG